MHHRIRNLFKGFWGFGLSFFLGEQSSEDGYGSPRIFITCSLRMAGLPRFNISPSRNRVPMNGYHRVLTNTRNPSKGRVFFQCTGLGMGIHRTINPIHSYSLNNDLRLQKTRHKKTSLKGRLIIGSPTRTRT